MASIEGLEVLFVAGFGPIVRSPARSKQLYVDTLGLPLRATPDAADYLHGEIEGVRHFALWPLAQAAMSCFGTSEWPVGVPEPNAWLELDVADVAAATSLLRERDIAPLVENRVEPWGQTVTRFLSPEGLLIGLTFTPWLRT